MLRAFPGDYIYLRLCPFDWSEKLKILDKKMRNAHGKNVSMSIILKKFRDFGLLRCYNSQPKIIGV